MLGPYKCPTYLPINLLPIMSLVPVIKLIIKFESTKHKRGVNCVLSSIAKFSQTASVPVRTGWS